MMPTKLVRLFVGMMVVSLLVVAAPPSPLAPASATIYAAPLPIAVRQQTAETDQPLPVGRLRFANNQQARAGDFVLEIDPLTPAPPGSQYELWLATRTGDLLNLGVFQVEDGAVAYTGSHNEQLLDKYQTLLISLEPVQTPDQTLSPQVVLSLTLLSTVASPLPFFDPDPALKKSLLLGTSEQIQLAIRHTGLLADALTADKQSEAHRHAEHIVNILNGETGDPYGDLDQDGQPQNPGDGFGVLAYLQTLESQLADLQDSLPITSAVADLPDKITLARTFLSDAQPVVEAAADKAAQIIAQDSVEEIKSANFLPEVRSTLQEVDGRLDAVYALALPDAEFLLYADQFTPLDQLPPAAPITTTQTITPSSAISSSEMIAHDHSATSTPPLISQPANPQAGDQWQNPGDDATYIYVAGGEFTMGANSTESTFVKEQPAHRVSVAGFWLQQTEVSNAQYRRCVTAGVCTAPKNAVWDQVAFAEHPVTHLSWQQAQVYAAWVGGRLPSEAEWEQACRSGDERAYPWGNEEPTAELANFNGNVGETTIVGAYPSAANDSGILDLSGNVWEWTSSLDQPYPYDSSNGRQDPNNPGKRIARGGSFVYSQYQLRCFTRLSAKPTAANRDFGLRVAVDVETSLWQNPVDGAAYLYIAGGEFTMGASSSETTFIKEQPAHQVSVAGFWLQQTEVSNAHYGRCVAAGVCSAPKNSTWDQLVYSDYPVTHVSWEQAQVYATWAGGRLPSEAEWEHACRNGDRRSYPWGEELPNSELANFNGNTGGITAVGSYPAAASGAGVLDLSGNVWEWTSSLDQPYPYAKDDGREDRDNPGKRIVRGGSFVYSQYQLRCFSRLSAKPTAANRDFGLRLVIPATSSE